MPDFHPDIKDLIQRMMTVDPAQRITMEEIKSHPAFRFCLPPAYIVPTPIPSPGFSNPIDPMTISEDIRISLSRIGITDDEIRDSALSNESNPVKIFIILLSRHIQPNELPWEKAITSMDKSFIQNNDIQDFGNSFVNQLNLGERTNRIPDTNLSSPEGFSLAFSPQWFQMAAEKDTYDFDEKFGPIAIPLPFLMTGLEIIVIDVGYIYFHPNDLRIIAKHKEGNTYLIIDAVFNSQDSICVRLQMKNVTQEDSEVIPRAILDFIEKFQNGLC